MGTSDSGPALHVTGLRTARAAVTEAGKEERRLHARSPPGLDLRTPSPLWYGSAGQDRGLT